MPSNEELSNRAKQLISDVQAFTNSAKQHTEEYKKLADKAYVNLQNYLKTKGVANVDDWLKKCQGELTPEEAASAQKILADLEPPQGINAMVQPTEIAKLIASWYLMKGAMPLFQAAALNAKAWYYNYLVIERLPVVNAGAVAGEIEVSTIATASEEFTASVELAEGEQISGMVAAAEVEVGEIAAADAAIAAEVGTMAAAEAATVWNVILAAAGALVLAGTVAYKKYKEKKNAEKLKDTITRIATARLYAFVAEKGLLAQTDEHSLLQLLNEALEKGDQGAQDFFKSRMADAALPKIDVNQCYQQLQQQDSDRHQMTEADPSYDDMVEIHKRQVEYMKLRKEGKLGVLLGPNLLP